VTGRVAQSDGTAARPRADARSTYDRLAPVYDALDAVYEVTWKRRVRALVFEGAAGLVLDVGAGTGANVPFYPEAGKTIGIDISPRMLDFARTKAERLGKPAEFLEMDLRHTSFPDNHFDLLAATFTLCVLPDGFLVPGLRELARIAKPAGLIRILDYGPPTALWAKAWMGVASLWTSWAFAARYDKTTEDHAIAAGLRLDSVRPLLGGAVKLITLRKG
jgi:phosphatidylethanolamine/phosphatidyl-N-methylethanolamine N-methyltransferase